jgi:hypothetical protein
MALEKIQGTQIVSWQPPLPQRAFAIVVSGVTSDNTDVAGLSTDGKRYGYFILNTMQWGVQEGFHTPPVQPGEKFQVWQASYEASNFPVPSAFASGSVATSNEPQTLNGTSAADAPDLFNVYTMTENREAAGGLPLYTLADPVVHTIAAVQQAGPGSWYVYFSPVTAITVSTSTMGIITIPRPFNPRYLGQVGHVSGINYTYAIPGGPSQLTCVLQVEPNYRTDALNPGRIITAHRGCSCIWEGQLTEPEPAATGWTLTANGVGTYGSNFYPWWQAGSGPVTKSNGWFPDGPVDFAIARGLRWSNRGIGMPNGIYVGPVQPFGGVETVSDWMNLLCTGGSLVWELVQPASASSWPPGPWELVVYSLPTDQSGNPLQTGPPAKVQTRVLQLQPEGKWGRTDLLTASPRRPPDLFLVNTSPVARTLVADYNTLVLNYQVTPDVTATSTVKAQAATYGTTFVDVPGSVTAHGRMEYPLDLSSYGSMTAAQVQQVGLNILSKFVRANFASAFSVMPGQLLNPGGFPVDLGLNWGGAVCTVQGVNAAQGGEVGMAPLTFVIGQYEYDDDTQTATVTPYQNQRTDMASVISQLYPQYT